jgi:hypothetical protein
MTRENVTVPLSDDLVSLFWEQFNKAPRRLGEGTAAGGMFGISLESIQLNKHYVLGILGIGKTL